MLQKTDKPPPELCGEPSSVAVAMLNRAMREPNRPAFGKLAADGEGQLWFSWGQIALWVADACAAIEAIKLPSGAHVATLEYNSLEWIVLDLACQVLGCVHVAIDPRWPETMVDRLLEQSDARLVYRQTIESSSHRRTKPHVLKLEWKANLQSQSASPSDLERLMHRAKAISSDAPAQMLFTSGTSGEPKGVLLSHRNLVTNALAKLEAAPQFEQDLRLNILPFCHAYARTCELSTWVLSNSRLAIARNWSDFLRQASRLHPTLINLVPHLAHKLLHDEGSKHALAPTDVVGRLGGKVRLLQVGGAAIADALWHRLERCGLPPLQGYGLTEASPVVCSNREGKQRPGTIGPPVAGVEVRVDTEKQLWVRGDNVMCGYYRDREATQARIQDGWLATGDLVEQDHLGHYRVIGRMSEVIALSTGFKVSPELIETRLSNIPCIERVLIVGQDKPYTVAMIWPAWSTLPANLFADVSQGRDSMDLRSFYQDLADFVGQRLADLPIFMHPQKFILVTESLNSDSEFINPKGNLRRNLTITRLQTQIDKAYS